MDTFKKILKIILILVVVVIIVFNVVLIYKAHNSKEEMPDFLGYTPYIIISGSMEPKIPINSIIVTKKVDKDKIEVGDIVSYVPNGSNKVVTHRVVKMTYLPTENWNGKNIDASSDRGVTEKDSEILYEMKGDSNIYSDGFLITYSQIKGKYLFTIPILGKIVSLAKTPQGVVILFACMIAAYVVYYIVSNKQKNYNK